jgi:hypothetical protein
MAGVLATLTAKTWTYKEKKPRTPILILDGDRRMWAEWDEKDIRTMLPAEIEGFLSEIGEYQVILRLRESHALELQQRLLASMGRVGLVVQMPATFPVTVKAYYLTSDQTPTQFALPLADACGGVCYVGRDDKGNENPKLVLTESVIDELLRVTCELTDDNVHPKAKETAKRWKTATSLARDLQRGLTVPRSDKSGFSPILADTPGVEGKAQQNPVGLIARNPPSDSRPEAKHGAFILVLSDEDYPGTIWPNREPQVGVSHIETN